MPRRTPSRPTCARCWCGRSQARCAGPTRCARCRSPASRRSSSAGRAGCSPASTAASRSAQISASMRSRTRPPWGRRSRQPGESPMLEKEVALVTGASRGIGHAIALALGGAGTRVIGTATSAEGAAKLEAALKSHGCNGRGTVLDAGNPASIDALVEDLDEKGEMPSILVNNAAITRDTLLLRMKPEDWDAVITTNLTSVVGVTGNAGQANYAAAKAGVIGFTKSLARELASRGISVNAVAPGFIDTDMTRVLNDEQRSALLAQIPMGRLGTPDDIAQAVLFLVSPHAAYITGETLHVNGGMYMA